MDRYCLNLVINEVKGFKKLQKQWDYADLEDLIAHYIEEDVISSREDLVEVSKVLETKLGIKTEIKAFNNRW